MDIPTEGESDSTCAERFIRYVRELNAQLWIPSNLGAFGLNSVQPVEELLPLCMDDHCHLTNPRRVTEDDFRTLLTELIERPS